MTAEGKIISSPAVILLKTPLMQTDIKKLYLCGHFEWKMKTGMSEEQNSIPCALECDEGQMSYTVEEIKTLVL